ncbi:LANO_0E06612g1_1 [Lachancea nothofagi CBS 11611]|uniref:Autophagy-related protein 11 n=1 Tax=Lachancea nothofagi CBS 11611 TaxID=1266666 RepID=A0A1G4JTX5_9SACH|nr:LANO_0E06612g1_1 [Lachancea nothofagi CBS 11611]
MSDYSATIYNAITGTNVSANVRSFLAMEDFKRFVSQQLRIPLDHTFILLPYGAKLKKSIFLNCLRESVKSEFYVFDRRLFSFAQDPSSTDLTLKSQEVQDLLGTVTQNNQVTLIKPVTSPLLEVNNVSSNLNYRKVVSMLTTNMGWLSALDIDAHYFLSIIHNTIRETNTIFQCFTICSQYLKLYCYDIEKLYDSNVEFLNQLTNDSSAHQWQKLYDGLLTKINTVNDEKERHLSDFLRKQELEDDYNNLKTISRSVNSRLRQLKDQINDNFQKRQAISTKSQELKVRFEQSPSNYKMENHMMQKFEEMIMKLRQSTHDTLALTSEEFTSEVLEEVSQKISEDKNSTIRNLFTVAQSLFVKAEESLVNKKQLQEEMILLLSQTAYIQVQILDVKTVLLRECNQELETLQNCELRLSRVEDLPILYGLHLIEKLRRKQWHTQVMNLDSKLSQEFQVIGDAEEKRRQKWNETFGQSATLFNIPNTDLAEVRKACNSKLKKISDVNYGEVTTEKIERFLFQLSQQNVAAESVAILQKNLESAINVSVNLKTTPRLGSSFSLKSSSSETDLVKGYKRRIQKLESLLHDAKFSNINSWPSGILNNATWTAFDNNVPPLNVKMSMLLADGKEVAPEYLKESSLVNFAKIQRELEQHREELAMSIEETKKLKTQIVDFEDEKNAYRETLSALNHELYRLTSEEEQRERKEFSQYRELKGKIDTIGKLNSSLLNEAEAWKHKYEQETRLKEDLLSDMANLENEFVRERADLLTNITELREEVSSLKVSAEESVGNHIAAPTQEIVTDEVPDKAFDEAMELNKETLTRVFEIFANGVYILENIGLLLSKTDEQQFLITRVKGLRKGFSQSDLLESGLELKGPVSIKSTAFQDVKKKFEASVSSSDAQLQRDFLSTMNKLFGNNFYETSVIKRFKDIEALAKKLTKENKFKRGLLETYQREKITIKNFQVGDMALFLPTRDVPDSVSSSVSSLASSFSSVDLSTPPPPGFTSAQNEDHRPGKSRRENNDIKKIVPWAAFTAFDETTRYFLKDNEKFTVDRDWFVGKITSVERIAANDSASIPFKLPKGASWVQVTADFVSGKNF